MLLLLCVDVGLQLYVVVVERLEAVAEVHYRHGYTSGMSPET